MKIINLSEGNSLLNQYVAELRDVHVQNDRMRFRRNIERIGEIMAYEMSKALTYSVKQVQTPLGTATASTHDDKIVIATVFRAGLPLHTGFLNMFDHADNAFVSAFRFYKDDEHRIVDVHIEYIAAPSLNDRTLLLVDPMLATGESMELAWKAFLTKGKPAKLQMACVIASQQGVAHMAELFPGDDVTLWCAAIDPVLDEHKYIVPGLGDAGDIIRNTKILGQNRHLERADLVGDVAVPGDGVRRGGEQVDALPLHGVGHHIVGDDRGIKAHLGEAAGSQPRPLQIGPGLGAEHLEVLVLTAGGPDHGADDGLAKALGQNRTPLRDQLCQMVAHDLHGGIPAVQGFHRVLHDGLHGVLPCRQRLLGHLGAAIGDLAVAIGGGGAGVGQIIGRLLQEGILLRSALVPHLPRG